LLPIKINFTSTDLIGDSVYMADMVKYDEVEG